MSMEELKAQRDELFGQADSITDAAVAEKRSLTDDEKRDHADLLDQARGIRELMDTRAARDAEAASQLPALTRALDAADGAETRDAETGDETRRLPAEARRDETRPVYGERSDQSFFVDVWRSRAGYNAEAAARIAQNDAYTLAQLQQRDLANVANKGAEAVVPIFLQDRFEKARVAKAITSGLTNQQVLPAQGDTISIPYQTGSAAVAELTQADPLNTLQETNAAFDVASESVIEVGGTQDISNYVIDRGTLGVGIDVVIANHLSDLLAADENTRVLAKAIAGAAVSKTYTATTGTLVGIYKTMADANQAIHTGNLQPATAIVVHPRRFAAWAAEFDSNNRPLMLPMTVAQNPLAYTSGDGHQVAQGFTGYSIHGLPVYVDALMSTTTNTNQDVVLIADWAQQYTWLGPIMVDVDPSPMFKQSGKTVRARRYFATMNAHRTAAFAKITGTGLATPSFT